MRGDLLLSVRVARSVAAAASSLLNQRARLRGRPGGKGPGVGLFAAKELQVPHEGQILVRYVVARRAVVQQPTHRVVHQHPAVELLPDDLGRLAAQHPAALPQVRRQLVVDRLHFPASVVQLGHRSSTLRAARRPFSGTGAHRNQAVGARGAVSRVV